MSPGDTDLPGRICYHPGHVRITDRHAKRLRNAIAHNAHDDLHGLCGDHLRERGAHDVARLHLHDRRRGDLVGSVVLNVAQIDELDVFLGNDDVRLAASVDGEETGAAQVAAGEARRRGVLLGKPDAVNHILVVGGKLARLFAVVPVSAHRRAERAFVGETALDNAHAAGKKHAPVAPRLRGMHEERLLVDLFVCLLDELLRLVAQRDVNALRRARILGDLGVVVRTMFVRCASANVVCAVRLEAVRPHCEDIDGAAEFAQRRLVARCGHSRRLRERDRACLALSGGEV